MACGGYDCTRCCSRRRDCNGSSSIRIEWARTAEEFDAHMKDVHTRFGIAPELWYAPGIDSRWELVRHLVRKSRARSLLDVGGIGSYSTVLARSRCINVRKALRCVRYNPGAPLPYSNQSFELTMAETVLHHAARNAVALLAEMVRTSKRWVLLAEDVLEREHASRDVRSAFKRHDGRAIYRSLADWITLGLQLGLRLRRILFLHRVPLHVLREAARCDLGYAPMAYLLFELGNGDTPAQSSSSRTSQLQSAMGSTRVSTQSWHALRAREESDAGLDASLFAGELFAPLPVALAWPTATGCERPAGNAPSHAPVLVQSRTLRRLGFRRDVSRRAVRA